MEKDFEKMVAVAELATALHFWDSLGELPLKQMLQQIEAVDPSFIRHEKEKWGSHRNQFAWHLHYGFWIVDKLREKYPAIWESVAQALRHTHQHSPYRCVLSDTAMSQVKEIIKKSRF